MALTGTRYLAFDLGAESSRAVVGTWREGKLELEELHRFPTRAVTVRGTQYWDILYIFAEMKEALLQYGLKYGPQVSGIGVDSWGVDFGLLGPSGQLLQNPVQYRDRRIDGILDQAFEVLPGESIYARTGIQLLPINSLYQLWALRKTSPEVLREAHAFLMIPDLLHYFLTGRCACEYSNATTTQMLDVRRRRWSRSLMQAFGLPIDIMPEIMEPGTVLGLLEPSIAQEAGLEPAPVIAPCTHDTGSAVAGIPAEGEGWAYISCGTWSVLGAELTAPVTSPQAMECNFTNEGGIAGTIRFLKNIMGLWVLQQCRAAWARRGEPYSYAELTDMARSAPAFETILNIDDPLFFNSPDMTQAVAAYCEKSGQLAPQGVAATVRAILEGIALRYAAVLGELESILGKRFDRIHMVGGGTRNDLLCQMAADATARPVIAGPVEATALGNLAVQAMATGQIGNLGAARAMIANSAPLKVYEPRDTGPWRPILEHFEKITLHT